MSRFGMPIRPRSPPHLLEPSFIHPFTVQKRKSLASNTNTISNESTALRLFDNLIPECGTPETAFLTLISKYRIDLDVLQRIGERRLESSFSKVTYKGIADIFGLDPADMYLSQIPQFEVQRSWLPLAVVKNICHDVELADVQYGNMMAHNSEEARSRYITTIFNRIIYLFGRRLTNHPEQFFGGDMTNRSRIEHQFLAFGATVVLFIQVKKDLLCGKARLDQIAQVLAEADACDYRNSCFSLWVPILGILCDGCDFEFFVYDSSTRDFSLSGRIRGLEQYQSDISFLRSIKRTAEYIYDFFLAGYTNGLRAFLNRPTKATNRQGTKGPCQRASSLRYAEGAIWLARHAAAKAEVGDAGGAEDMAKRAVEMLGKSVEEAPGGRRVVGFMKAWDEDEMEEW